MSPSRVGGVFVLDDPKSSAEGRSNNVRLVKVERPKYSAWASRLGFWRGAKHPTN